MTRTKHSRRVRRIVLAAIAAPLVIVVVMGALFAAWLHGTKVPVLSGETYLSVEKIAVPNRLASFTPAPNDPVFILVIGNDERPGLAGARGDSLHLIGINPQQGKATIIGFPRDLGVNVPGSGNNKINYANAVGGAALSVRTVSELVGVPIQYAVETNFDGFIGLIDELGPIVVDAPQRMNDPDSGSDFQQGLNTLPNGERALAFSRDRHTFATGDIKRSENQGLVLLGILAKIRADGGGPAGTFKALGNLGRHTHLEGIGLRDLYNLGRLGNGIDPASVRNLVVPVAGGNANGNLTLLPEAKGLFDDFRDDAVLQSH